MIRQLRNSGIGQIFLGGVVVAIILAFVLTGTSSSGGLSSEDCVVEVGKECVNPKDFFASYGLLSAIGGGGINEAAAKRFRLKEKVALGLAERLVLEQQAREWGIATGEKDLDEELIHGHTRVSLPAEGQLGLAASLGMCVPGPGGCAPGTVGLRAIQVTKDGQFDYDVYKRSVRIWTKRSMKQFKEMQQREYTAERVRELVRSRVRVSPEEAFLAYSRIRSEATARTVSLSTAWFERYAPGPTSEEVEQWTANHADALKSAVDASEKSWQSGCAVVSEILIGNADPTSEQANEAKKKAEDVRRAALSGRNFDQLARENSDSGSAQLGGRIGCLGQSYGAGASVLLEAADELSRPGSISPVIESIRGFHVLKLVGKVDEKNKSKLISEYQAYKLASADFAKDRALSFGQRLIKSAESGTTLEQALADQLGELFTEEKHPAKDAEGAPRVEISRAITIDQNPFDGATGDVPPGVALFSLEEEDDLIAEPIGTESGFVVMQLKSKELLTKEKFQEDEQSIIATLQARKAEQALSQYVSQLIKNAGGVRINEKYVPPADEDNEKAAEQDG